ncbi:MAG: hypothetical protein ACI4QR_01670, partial [Eubacteriales bacterium]
LAYEAYVFADATIRTIYRYLVSKRNFLNWKTAAAADREKNGMLSYIRKMWFSPVCGVLSALIPSATMKIMGILWISFPFFAYIISSKRETRKTLSEHEKDQIYEYAVRMWSFFADNVNAESNFLPPDNYQYSPVERTAYRTSPTNIGLYLVSLLGARDLSFITSEELQKRAFDTANSLSKMIRWKGHFYNWYDIKTLGIIGEPFISTVDSGNLICSLTAFCEGIKEYAYECPKLLDVLRFYQEIIKNTDMAALYDSGSRFFYIGYDVKNEKFSDCYYDTFMSESRMTSFYAVASGDVPREHFFAGARPLVASGGYTGVASWSGTSFEYFMPSLFLPVVPDSLCDEALSFAFHMEKKYSAAREIYGKKRKFFGISESGYFGFDAEMNYQYKAFGLCALSLDPNCKNAMVISPYSSFLMMRKGVSECLSNLRAIKNIGAYGEYGFYEALDFDPGRVGNGYAVIKSYMAHHVGMSFIACVNMLKEDIFVSRFMRFPKMRASRELLCEKIAVGAPALPARKKEERTNNTPNIHVFSEAVNKEEIKRPEYSLIFPDAAMLSNNKLRLLASSSGHIAVYDGEKTLFFSEFERFSLGTGMRFYAVADDIALPLVPLCERAGNIESDFEFYYNESMILFSSTHKKEGFFAEAELVFRISPDREMFSAGIKINGSFSRAYAFVYAEPVMENERTFLSHKSFSNLFTESRYSSDENALIIKRRSRSGAYNGYFLGVCAYPDSSCDDFETRRGEILPLMYGERDIAGLCTKKLSGSEGEMIVPSLAMRSGYADKRGRCGFTFAAATGEDEVLFMLSLGRADFSERRFALIPRLQYGASGIAPELSSAENYILRSFCFGNTSSVCIRKKTERDMFWKHGISGENPFVLAEFQSGGENEISSLASLIGVFKYMCIRGVRFDLLILYPENDFYRMTNGKRISEIIDSLGCRNFLSRENGIFPMCEN